MARNEPTWRSTDFRIAALWLTAATFALAPASPPAMAAAQQQPTLRRVALTQAGVATFDYRATVDGAATLWLDLPRADIADALRSLVVRDAAGTVTGVELAGDDPASAALAHLPIPAASLATPIELLQALRGEPVSVAGPRPMSGIILSAQGWRPASGGPSGGVPHTRVTLLTSAGLQTFALDDVASVQLDDQALRLQLDDALAALRGVAVAADRRRLAIGLQGQGTREVDLSLVLPVPLWKATYRLLQPEAGATRARLQAWAVVENAGLDDWRDIGLVLQAGNPVAFRQDVYATLHVARPVVAADLLAHPAPREDQGGTALEKQESAASASGGDAAAEGAMRPMARFAAPAMAPAMAPAPAPLSAPAAPLAAPTQPADIAGEPLAASFTLPRPVSLAAGHSAALPFLDLDLPSRRVWLLAAFAAHPLAGIELTNDGKTSLPPGSVTTIGEEGFVGDALLGVFPAGATRVLSYAEDATVTATWDATDATTLVGVASARGVLRISRRERRATAVSLSATGAEAASGGGHALVDIPFDPGTTLSTEPSGLPVQRTPGFWRVDVTLAGAGPIRLVANADRLTEQTVAVLDDPGTAAALAGDTGINPRARAALSHVADLRTASDARDTALGQLRGQREGLAGDEQRVRENLAAVGPNDPLRGRFLDALAHAEDAIAALDGRIAQARQAAQAAHAALADAVAGLSF